MLISIAVVLAILSGLVIKGRSPAPVASKPDAPQILIPPSAETQRPHLSPRMRATEELKTGAHIQNQIQLLTYLLDQGQEDEFYSR